MGVAPVIYVGTKIRAEKGKRAIPDVELEVQGPSKDNPNEVGLKHDTHNVRCTEGLGD